MKRTLSAALLALSAAAACGHGSESQEPSTALSSVVAASPARGMWIWKTSARLDAANGTSELLESVKYENLTEVYLSANGVLDDARLVPMVTALNAAGVRVEALAGDATWYQPAHRPDLLAFIDAVNAYNLRNAASARFAAVHLDIEPYQIVANKTDHSWLPALVDTIAAARDRDLSYGLDTSADFPRFALQEDGPALAAVTPRVFVMLYELADKSTSGMATASAGVFDVTYPDGGAAAGNLVVGVSADDYPTTLDTILGAVQSSNATRPHYAGWAIHDETSYRSNLGR